MKKIILLIVLAASLGLLSGCTPGYVDPALAELARVMEAAGVAGQAGGGESAEAGQNAEGSAGAVDVAESWEPYFTGDEPEWRFNPEAPWVWNREIQGSENQSAGINAHQSLYGFLSGLDNYAGAFINSEGYLTVLLSDPTAEQASEIAARSAAPVWIVAADYSLSELELALDSAVSEIQSWINENPGHVIGPKGWWVDQQNNVAVIEISGSGVPALLEATNFPSHVSIDWQPTVDPSIPHDIPRTPVTIWERDGVIIRGTYESYPEGVTHLYITALHNVEGMRMFAPYSPLRVDKYVDGEWIDVSGNFFIHDVYMEIFDIPAGQEKTVSLSIITPETLGSGLYRATYGGFIALAATSDISIHDAVVGAQSGDNVYFEFVIR